MYNQQPFHLVVVELPDDLAGTLFWLPFLDSIGPARFADIDELPAVNGRKVGPIREVPIP